MVACTFDPNWPVYIVVSLITFFSGLVILLPLHIIWKYSLGHLRKTLLDTRTRDDLSKLRTAAEGVFLGRTMFNKAVMIVFWLIDIVVAVVYLVDAVMSVGPGETSDCGTVRSDPLHIVWIVAMCVCLIRFVIKFVGSSEKLHMWVELFSIVDHLTIGPTFVSIYYDRNWLGLKFLRLVYLLKTPDILQIVTLLKSRNSIRVAKAASAVLTVWMCGAGMFHILENNGDPFYESEYTDTISFGNCFYYILITLTTIGYGDMYPRTVLGKAFIIIFVVLALATFCTLIGDMGKVLSARTKYRNAYKRTFGKRHLVICGGITFETLTTVVKNFIHEDSSMENTDIVIIDVEKPSAELQAFFRRHFNDVTFIQGTVLDIPTLKLAKVQNADVVLILANRRADDQDDEDAANIMRAAAIKNISAEIRIIIQLLQHHNKEQLLHMPSWNWHNDVDGEEGDEIICISELKMGFMAQNCLAPGIVTMLSNLICMRSFKEIRHGTWINEYGYGAGHEIYTEMFATDFYGLRFTDAAIRCMMEYGILLVAVRSPDRHQSRGLGQTKLRINPGSNYIIKTGDVGVFIAQGPAEVKRVSQTSVKMFDSQSSVDSTTKLVRLNSENGDDDLLELVGATTSSICYGANMTGQRAVLTSDAGLGNSLSDDDNNNEREMFDRTNMFHWCPPQSLDDASLDSDTVRHQSLSDHVIFILCSSGSSEGLGLVNFIKPLRASSIATSQLKTIVFYSDRTCIEPEWKLIHNYPRLFIYEKSRSIYADLRRLNAHRCSMCLVLGEGGGSKIDDTLVDKNAILTTKNIISLQKMETKISKIGVLANPDQFRQQVAVATDIPMLIELEHDASVAYIDDDDDDDPNQPLYQTMPYVCGRVFLASVLDSLVATAYMSRDVLTLTRALLTGGETDEFEKVLAEGVGIVRRGTLVHSDAARRRSTLTLLSLSDAPLANLDHQLTYGHLMVDALRTCGLLCLGLYRLFEHEVDETQEPKEQPNLNRYVITHPQFMFKLFPSDKVYALKPYENDAGADTSMSSDAAIFDDVTKSQLPLSVVQAANTESIL